MIAEELTFPRMISAFAIRHVVVHVTGRKMFTVAECSKQYYCCSIRF